MEGMISFFSSNYLQGFIISSMIPTSFNLFPSLVKIGLPSLDVISEIACETATSFSVLSHFLVTHFLMTSGTLAIIVSLYSVLYTISLFNLLVGIGSSMIDFAEMFSCIML